MAFTLLDILLIRNNLKNEILQYECATHTFFTQFNPPNNKSNGQNFINQMFIIIRFHLSSILIQYMKTQNRLNIF